MSGADGARGERRTQLLVVADGDDRADDVSRWLSRHLSDGMVARVTGFYAAVSALTERVSIVVMDAAIASPRDEWQLAALRNHCSRATVIVIAKEPRRSALAGALHADLAVDDTATLPPFRELMTGPSMIRLSDAGSPDDVRERLTP